MKILSCFKETTESLWVPFQAQSINPLVEVYLIGFDKDGKRTESETDATLFKVAISGNDISKRGEWFDSWSEAIDLFMRVVRLRVVTIDTLNSIGFTSDE